MRCIAPQRVHVKLSLRIVDADTDVTVLVNVDRIHGIAIDSIKGVAVRSADVIHTVGEVRGKIRDVIPVDFRGRSRHEC